MLLKSISIRNYRSLESFDARFEDGVNVLSGENGRGKTNIIEAAYIFSRGRAYRAVRDTDMLRFGETTASVRIEYVSERGENSPLRSLGMSLTSAAVQGANGSAGQGLTGQTAGAVVKTFYEGKRAMSGAREMLGRFRSVLFCPDHLSLVQGAPENRRSFMDCALGQFLPQYVAAYAEWADALKQRNALLRGYRDGLISESAFNAQRLDWNFIYAGLCGVLTDERARFVRTLSPWFAEFCRQMTGVPDASLRYVTDAQSEAAKAAFGADGAKLELSGLDVKPDRERHVPLLQTTAERCSVSRKGAPLPPLKDGHDGINGPATSPDHAADGFMPDYDAGGQSRDGAVGEDPADTPAVSAGRSAAADIYMELADAMAQREREAGTTLFGPQHDDIEVIFGGADGRRFASQGQQRSMAVAMKLAEGELFAAASGEHPVYLLDDVLSELDKERRAFLLERLAGRQVIISTCDTVDLPNAHVIEV